VSSRGARMLSSPIDDTTRRSLRPRYASVRRGDPRRDPRRGGQLTAPARHSGLRRWPGTFPQAAADSGGAVSRTVTGVTRRSIQPSSTRPSTSKTGPADRLNCGRRYRTDLRIARLLRDAAGLTADNPAILWRYAGILSMRLSGFRTRPGAELDGAGRHRADTQARRAQEGPLTEAEHASSRPAATAAEAAGGESIRRDEHTPSAYQNTRTRGLNGRAQKAADHARRQHRWPHLSGVAAGANRQDRPDEVSGGRP
jgi:hypothetical protein